MVPQLSPVLCALAFLMTLETLVPTLVGRDFVLVPEVLVPHTLEILVPALTMSDFVPVHRALARHANYASYADGRHCFPADRNDPHLLASLLQDYWMPIAGINVSRWPSAFTSSSSHS